MYHIPDYVWEMFMKYPLHYEELIRNNGCVQDVRMAVPGGWVYQMFTLSGSSHANGIAMCFVPDPSVEIEE